MTQRWFGIALGKRLSTVSCEHLNSRRVQAQVPPANFRPPMSAIAPSKMIRVVWIVVALMAGCAGTVAALTQLYGDAWKQQGVALLNNQIQGELVVQDVDLSWWNGFPNISVDLWEASLTLPASSDTLLAATRIGVEMDVWTLWNNSPELSSLTWSGGHLQVVEMPDGSWNFSSLLNVTPEDSAADVRLDKVVLEDVQVEATFRDGRLWQGQLREVDASQQGRGHWSWDVRASQVQLPHPDVPCLAPPRRQGRRSDDVGRRHRLGVPRHGLPVRLGVVWNASQRPNQPPEVDVASTLTQSKLEGILVEAPWRDMGSFGHAVKLDATFRNGAWQASWNASPSRCSIGPRLHRADHGASGRMRRPRHSSPDPRRTDMGSDPRHGSRGRDGSLLAAPRPTALGAWPSKAQATLTCRRPCWRGGPRCPHG